MKGIAVLCLHFLIASFCMGQQVISGFVVSDSTWALPGGIPLRDICIVEKGTRNRTQTDQNGKFSMQVKKSGVLIFSCAGWRTEELKIDNNANVTITLRKEEEYVYCSLIDPYPRLSIGYFGGYKFSPFGASISYKFCLLPSEYYSPRALTEINTRYKTDFKNNKDWESFLESDIRIIRNFIRSPKVYFRHQDMYVRQSRFQNNTLSLLITSVIPHKRNDCTVPKVEWKVTTGITKRHLTDQETLSDQWGVPINTHLKILKNNYSVSGGITLFKSDIQYLLAIRTVANPGHSHRPNVSIEYEKIRNYSEVKLMVSWIIFGKPYFLC